MFGLFSPDELMDCIGNKTNNEKVIKYNSYKQNQMDKIGAMHRLLTECSLVADKSQDSDGVWAGDSNINITNREMSKKPTSKISDADLNKIREVLNKEYGKTILLMPKHDLERCIQLIKNFTSTNSISESTKCVSKIKGGLDNKGIKTLKQTNSTGQPLDLNPACLNKQVAINEFSQLLDWPNLSKSLPTGTRNLLKSKLLEDNLSQRQDDKIPLVNSSLSDTPFEAVNETFKISVDGNKVCEPPVSLSLDQQLARFLSDSLPYNRPTRDIKNITDLQLQVPIASIKQIKKDRKTDKTIKTDKTDKKRKKAVGSFNRISRGVHPSIARRLKRFVRSNRRSLFNSDSGPNLEEIERMKKCIRNRSSNEQVSFSC